MDNLPIKRLVLQLEISILCVTVVCEIQSVSYGSKHTTTLSGTPFCAYLYS